MKALLKLLRDPSLADLDVDDPARFDLHAAMLARKRMLRHLKYEKLHKRTDRIEQLAGQLNKKVAGWVSYYGKYAGTSMHQIYAHINRRLVKWCMWKYRKFKIQAILWLKNKWREQSMLFVHWQQTRFFRYY